MFSSPFLWPLCRELSSISNNTRLQEESYLPVYILRMDSTDAIFIHKILAYWNLQLHITVVTCKLCICVECSSNWKFTLNLVVKNQENWIWLIISSPNVLDCMLWSATLPRGSIFAPVLWAGHHFHSVNWVAGRYKGEVWPTHVGLVTNIVVQSPCRCF